MQKYDVIVLAGGLGTRLGSEVAETPKPLVDVAGKPFLEWILDELHSQGISEVYLSIGYLGEKIVDHFGDQYRGIQIKYVRESTPLGTGGGIWLALQETKKEQILVLNGDTHFPIRLEQLSEEGKKSDADVAIALHEVRDTERYGAVELKESRISRFCEKGLSGPGLINGGIYAINRRITQISVPQKFSFEEKVLQNPELAIHGFVHKAPFIDIGIPSDLARARAEFGTKTQPTP